MRRAQREAHELGEIALRLEMPLGTLKWRHGRALTMLRKDLASVVAPE